MAANFLGQPGIFLFFLFQLLVIRALPVFPRRYPRFANEFILPFLSFSWLLFPFASSPMKELFKARVRSRLHRPSNEISGVDCFPVPCVLRRFPGGRVWKGSNSVSRGRREGEHRKKEMGEPPRELEASFSRALEEGRKEKGE